MPPHKDAVLKTTLLRGIIPIQAQSSFPNASPFTPILKLYRHKRHISLYKSQTKYIRKERKKHRRARPPLQPETDVGTPCHAIRQHPTSSTRIRVTKYYHQEHRSTTLGISHDISFQPTKAKDNPRQSIAGAREPLSRGPVFNMLWL